TGVPGPYRRALTPGPPHGPGLEGIGIGLCGRSGIEGEACAIERGRGMGLAPEVLTATLHNARADCLRNADSTTESIRDCDLMHGVEAVVYAGGVGPLADDLAVVVDPPGLSRPSVRIVDRRVGAVAQEEPMGRPRGVRILADDLAGEVDATGQGADRSRV